MLEAGLCRHRPNRHGVAFGGRDLHLEPTVLKELVLRRVVGLGRVTGRKASHGILAVPGLGEHEGGHFVVERHAVAVGCSRLVRNERGADGRERFCRVRTAAQAIDHPLRELGFHAPDGSMVLVDQRLEMVDDFRGLLRRGFADRLARFHEPLGHPRRLGRAALPRQELLDQRKALQCRVRIGRKPRFWIVGIGQVQFLPCGDKRGQLGVQLRPPFVIGALGLGLRHPVHSDPERLVCAHRSSDLKFVRKGCQDIEHGGLVARILKGHRLDLVVLVRVYIINLSHVDVASEHVRAR